MAEAGYAADRLELALEGRFRGVVVVGDVHGHAALFEPMIALAEAEGRFLLSLGDLVDRGPASLVCLRRMRALMEAGRGLFIRGNHDDKLHRALLGRPVVRGEALTRTLAEFDAAADGAAMRQWFIEAYEAAPFLVRLGSLIAVHGGFARRMLEGPPSFGPMTRAHCLYGQAAPATDAEGKPVRLYGWVEAIPAGTTVVIGHDPISGESLLVRDNARGGRLIHLDSRAGKGGPLSALVTDREGRIERALQVRHATPAPVPIGLAPVSA